MSETISASHRSFVSVSEVGMSEEQNPRFRKTMEDGHVIIDQFAENPQQAFFAVYDGHGGREAVNFVVENLHKKFSEELKKTGRPREALEKAFLQTDDEMGEMQIMYNGTTAVVCFIHCEEQEGVPVRTLYTANVGDARAVICRNGVAKRLSHDHKATDKEEAQRVVDSNGVVIYGRVSGILSVTRALGDHAMKPWVLGLPYMTEEVLDTEHEFIILACDGVWDVLSDQEAVDLIRDEKDAQRMSVKLKNKALELGSTDNISAMVVRL